jgi:hypothetical protein
MIDEKVVRQAMRGVGGHEFLGSLQYSALRAWTLIQLADGFYSEGAASPFETRE